MGAMAINPCHGGAQCKLMNNLLLSPLFIGVTA